MSIFQWAHRRVDPGEVPSFADPTGLAVLNAGAVIVKVGAIVQTIASKIASQMATTKLKRPRKTPFDLSLAPGLTRATTQQAWGRVCFHLSS
jgi:hypothetical protein